MTVTTMPDPTPVVAAEVILGVDTHRDVHVACVVSVLGVVRGIKEFPATADGYRELLIWARGHGALRRAGVECTGSYGAALSRVLQADAVEVFDVNQPDKRSQRTRGKTDAVDAESAARAVLSGRATVIAKTGDGHVEALRLLKMVRDTAINARTKSINQLKAILVTADPALRETLTSLGPATLIRRCAELPDPAAGAGVAAAAVIHTLRVLAERILRLKAEAYEIEKRMTALVASHAPELLERPGIGPDSATALLVAAGDNAQRIRGEASFAALCGTSPVEASSGMTQRRRLNRGGDRQANAALHRITISRLRWDPRTQQYLQRRLADGKTRRESIRCIKRYIARETFNLIREAQSDRPTALAA
jgi:transposase